MLQIYTDLLELISLLFKVPKLLAFLLCKQIIFSKMYHMPIHEILLSRLGWCLSCYMELLGKLQKQIYRTDGPLLAASLEP